MVACIGMLHAILYRLHAGMQAFGESYVELDHARTSNALYLHETWRKVWDAGEGAKRGGGVLRYLHEAWRKGWDVGEG